MGMVEVKTAELEGAALDWAVAKADGLKADIHKAPVYRYEQNAKGEPVRIRDGSREFLGVGPNMWSPSVNWSQGGPLIDEHKIEFRYVSDDIVRAVLATGAAFIPTPYGTGETHLIAACRAIVAAKLGDTVSIPTELLK